MQPFHVIAYKIYGEETAPGEVTGRKIQSHFLVICESEERTIPLVKEATGEEFDKYNISKAEEILSRPSSQSFYDDVVEQVFSL